MLTVLALTLPLAGVGCGGEPWYVDEDGDGFGTTLGEGRRPEGAAVVDGDCDDTNATVHPEADELCDGLDTDCDGVVPVEEGDEDDDGFLVCAVGGAVSGGLMGGDCDDADPSVHPSADEGCDGIDTDCDGVPSGAETDDDGDGYVECAPSGWRGASDVKGGDCDDAHATAYPGSLEVCDGVDTDCDGTVPDAEKDDDGDGGVECTVVGEWLGAPGVVGGDCDDADAGVAAHLAEVCDGRDNDCDGQPSADELDPDRDGVVGCEWVQPWLGAPGITGGGDCDQEHTAVHPGADELRDGADTNCDGVLLAEEVDDDGDGYVEMPVVEPFWIGMDGMGGGDCDDTRPEIHPDQAELCNGIDDDCDGEPSRAELDRDGDGVIGCMPSQWQGGGAVPDGGDCNDFDGSVRPGASEVCDWADNDCDGLVDDDDPSVAAASFRTFYRDDDQDGFGVDTDTTEGCALPDGYAPAAGDCDDVDRHVHPFAREGCDGIDNDCNELVDDDDPDLDLALALTWWPDDDQDGYGDGTQQALVMCAPPDAFWSEDGRDCDDGDPNTHWDAPELCNGLDDDCDGHPDVPSIGGATSELGCDMCTTAFDYRRSNIHIETYDPCDLDPLAQDLCGNRVHDVRWREDATVLRPELFVFLPPSAGTFNNNLMSWVAHAGYRAITFGQANDVHLSDVCSSSQECTIAFHEEAFYGNDVSPYVDIGPHDSLDTRLSVLLHHLNDTYPSGGWDQYIDPNDDGPMWQNIILSGWSKSTTYLVYAAEMEQVGGLLFFSNPNNDLSDLVLTTPACRRNAIYHEDEYPLFDFPDQQSFEIGFRSMGMTGPTIDMDTERWPFPDGSQIFTTGTYKIDRPDCTAHKAVAFDNCMDTTKLIRPYVDIFCRIGDVDPSSCP
ncbi:MAG: putative metal-binding motif-containing protein [Alphaproteobacteria bacterium]|nr:putative metal-binding motif-containing protein [Alphaproteobacteria bacterium]